MFVCFFLCSSIFIFLPTSMSHSRNLIFFNSQLCPLYPHNPEVLLNELKSPSDLLDFGEFSNCMNFSTQDGTPLLDVVNPTFDYVPPKLVSLFVTDR
jgi:hypothetical protein